MKTAEREGSIIAVSGTVKQLCGTNASMLTLP